MGVAVYLYILPSVLEWKSRQCWSCSRSICKGGNGSKLFLKTTFWSFLSTQHSWNIFPFFLQDILTNTEDSHPYIILSEMSFDDVRSIVEFIYRGELNVGADHFASVLKTAEELQIRGLMEVSTEFKIKSVWSGFYCWSSQKCLKRQYTDTDWCER